METPTFLNLTKYQFVKFFLVIPGSLLLINFGFILAHIYTVFTGNIFEIPYFIRIEGILVSIWVLIGLYFFIIAKYKIMIRIKEKREPEEKRDPYYIVRHNYMIGYANGNTFRDATVFKDNPFVERYVKLLNSLTPTKGHWGVMLEMDRLYEHFEEGQINEDDYNFLCFLMFEECEDQYTINKEDEDHSYDFLGAVQADTEYSFLVFEGIDLIYVDEYGQEHETEIIS